MDKLDLTQPITAHHRDGRVVTAIRHGNGNVSWESGGNHHCLFVIDGELQASLGGWTIRNTAKQGGWVLRDEYAAKPSTPSNEELTQRMGEEAIDLLCKLAKEKSNDNVWLVAGRLERWIERAQTFVSDLPKPVDPIDPDLFEARTICSKEAARRGDSGLSMEYLAGDLDDQMEMTGALAAIKRGRVLEADAFTLAAGGTAHE